MRKLMMIALSSGLLLAATQLPAAATEVDGHDLFERLKALAGTWRGPLEGEGAAEAEAEGAGEAVHVFRVSAAGSVVMETMNPGTEYEMINMYHLDGDDLVLTHYCAGANQPHMRLDSARSTADVLVFDFAGGTNVDPAVDEHIHAAEIKFVDDDHIESVWKGYKGGEQAGVMTFHLERSR